MTATLSPPGAPPLVVRIRPAPSFEPPTDDARRPDEHPMCAGQLALFTSLHADTDEAGVAEHRSRSGTASGAGARNEGPGGPGPARGVRSTVVRTFSRGSVLSAPAGGHPPAEIHVAASRFVGVCVEILNGFRPVAHLRTLTTPFDYVSVTRQLTRRAMRIRMPPRRPRTVDEQVAVLCLRVCELRDGVAEAAAVLHVGGSSWALALRFEQRRGAWLCTLLQVI
jgi:hypothetical protein